MPGRIKPSVAETGGDEENDMEKGNKRGTKEQVLKRLLEADEPISGAFLADQLGLSRNAVWKAMEQLREEGYEIEAKTRQGYQLIERGNRLLEPLIAQEMEPLQAFQIKIYQEVDSTNDEAKRLAQKGAKGNLAVLAERQTAGKGRRGRSFFSQGPEGLYLSVLFRPKVSFQDSLKITTMTAVAVSRAIEKNCNVEVGIKWVNDLFIHGKKVCGILTEAGMDVETGDLDYAVVGIGVNVLKCGFPEPLREIVTTLEEESGEQVSRNKLAADILKELYGLYEELEKGEEETPSYQEEYVRRSVVLGKEITVYAGDRTYPAKAVGIDETIGLIVETAEGQKTLHSGEVSVRLST